MRMQVDYNEDMKVASMTDLDTGFNAVYDAVSDASLIDAFHMFIKDSKEFPYAEVPVYDNNDNLAYYQLTMKEAI